MNHNLQTGKIGEQYAEQFLASQNYLILTKNFHSRFGEIDIIGIDQSTNTLVFFEVKTRISENFGQPEDSFTYKKQSRMLKTIHHYYQLHKNLHTKWLKPCWRIDLITIKLSRQFKLLEIRHYKNLSYGN